MSLTFLELSCIMEFDNQDPPEGTLMGSGEESAAMKVVRAGMNLREDEEDTTFWQDFMNLCSDAEGMADLLGVKSAEVRRWSQRIRENIGQIKDINRTNPEGEDQSKVMATGDNDGALSMRHGVTKEPM